LRKGDVLAYDAASAIQRNIERGSLESTFMTLVEDVDVENVAHNIIDAMENA
jgi:hypothetical protein